MAPDVLSSPVVDAESSLIDEVSPEVALELDSELEVVESVDEGPDSERVMRDLAQQGHRLIFATSFGYLEPALRVAARPLRVCMTQACGGLVSVRLCHRSRYSNE